MRNVLVWVLTGSFLLATSCEMLAGKAMDNRDDDQTAPWDASLNTAASMQTRTPGLATEGLLPSTGWPPQWTIDIHFPAEGAPGFLGLAGHGTVTETRWSQLEKDIVLEINKFRAAPVKWCKENGLAEFDGISAYEEFWGSGPRRGNYHFPAQKLQPSQGLHKAALHQTLFGNVAHSDGSRVNEYVNKSAWGENVGPYSIYNQASGGASIAAKILNEVIRDRGVPDKGHRINVARANYTHVGVACYNNIVVMQFGNGVTDKNPPLW
jgi:uncharacterized protein YkwD